MSLTTPTIADVNNTIITQLSASFGQTIPILPKSFCRVLAKILAGVFILLWKYAGWMFLQLFVAYASFSETEIGGKIFSPLVEWGRLIGVGDPTPATRAELNVTVTVNEQTGSIPAGTKLVRASTQVIYSVVYAVALDAATVTLRVQASDDDRGNLGTGAIGNLEIGDELEFAQTLPYVNRTVTVASVVNTAADAETESAYRTRVIRRFQRKPQGGAYADYQAWGEEVDGILSVYPYSGNQPNEVDLYVEATEATSDEDGIPSTDQLESVLHSVQYDTEGIPNRAPVNAAISVYPISRVAVDFALTGLVVDDESTVTASIESALNEYLRGLEPYIEGLSTLPRTDRALSADAGGIVSQIVRAAGGTFGTLTMSINGTDLPSYTLQRGEKSKLGTLS